MLKRPRRLRETKTTSQMARLRTVAQRALRPGESNKQLTHSQQTLLQLGAEARQRPASGLLQEFEPGTGGTQLETAAEHHGRAIGRQYFRQLTECLLDPP